MSISRAAYNVVQSVSLGTKSRETHGRPADGDVAVRPSACDFVVLQFCIFSSTEAAGACALASGAAAEYILCVEIKGRTDIGLRVGGESIFPAVVVATRLRGS